VVKHLYDVELLCKHVIGENEKFGFVFRHFYYTFYVLSSYHAEVAPNEGAFRGDLDGTSVFHGFFTLYYFIHFRVVAVDRFRNFGSRGEICLQFG
jgi:hypothetical protein